MYSEDNVSNNQVTKLSNHMQPLSQVVYQVPAELKSVTTDYYIEEDQLRPNGVFIKGYQELKPYNDINFGGITLRRTANGKRAMSGIQLEKPISSRRLSCNF